MQQTNDQKYEKELYTLYDTIYVYSKKFQDMILQ